MSFPLVIGIGSSHGDDQAGWLMIEHLQTLGYPQAQSRMAKHPADVLDDMSSTTPLWICDACSTNEPAGTIHHWIWPTDRLADLQTAGTHDLSLPQVLELSQKLAQCPDGVEIWGISGKDWSPASRPGIEVQSAARDVASAIWNRCHA